MSRELAKSPYLRAVNDPEKGYIVPADAQQSIDVIYDDMEQVDQDTLRLSSGGIVSGPIDIRGGLYIRSGSPNAGYVLACDASGGVSWVSPLSGPQGPQGEQGPVGPQGLVGPQGSPGPKGDPGDTGPQGPKGDTGDTGPQGPVGAQGLTGPQGSAGAKGDKGDTGAAGAQGPQGVQGPQGLKGDTGDTGPQGPQGPQGLQGPIGLTGPVGPKGDTGSTGPKGDTGAAGPVGPTGPAGADGNRILHGTGAPGAGLGSYDDYYINDSNRDFYWKSGTGWQLQFNLGGGGGASLTNLIDVTSHGAVGDDTTDDTSAIQAALTAGTGKAVYLPAKTYKITAAVTIPANTRLVGAGTLHQVTAGTSGVIIGGSGVTLDGISLKGRHASAAFSSGEYAILLTAPNLAGAYKNIVVKDVTVSLFGHYGILMQYVDGFEISGCVVRDIGYTGIGAMSGANGLIQGNRVDNITPGSSGDMYGISLTYGSTESASDPATRDTVVDGNIVSNVNWEGIETHSGLRITFSNNQILHCKTGIAFAMGDVSSITDGVVSGNVVDYVTDDYTGADNYAFQVYGLAAVPATGVTITGNTFRRHTYGSLFRTSGAIVANNVFDRSYQMCLWLALESKKSVISGNTFIDNWDNSGGWTYAIRSASDAADASATIVGNSIARGALSATGKLINDRGCYFDPTPAGISFKMLANDFSAIASLGSDIEGKADAFVIELADMTTDPLAGPLTKVFSSKSKAAKPLLEVLDTDGARYPLQPSLLEKTVFMMTPNATTSALYLGSAGTSAGTLSTVAPATVGSALFPITTGFSTGTTAATVAGLRMTNNAFRHSNLGGFYLGCHLGLPDASYDQSGASTGSRIFVGMSDQTSMVGSDNPSGNYAGFMRNNVNGGYLHSNWQFVTKNGTTQTLTDTGMAFTPQNMYAFYVHSKLGVPGTIFWTIKNLTTGSSQSGSVSATLPSTTANLGPVVQIINVNAVARILRVAKVYCEN